MMQYNNMYVQQIYQLLTPLVGEFMAKGIIKSQIQKLGKTDETVDKPDLLVLADDIRKGLVAFIGTDLATKVSQKIKEF